MIYEGDAVPGYGGYGGSGGGFFALIIFALLLLGLLCRRDRGDDCGGGYGYGRNFIEPEMYKDQAEDTGKILFAMEQQNCDLARQHAAIEDCIKTQSWDIERREMQSKIEDQRDVINDQKRKLELGPLFGELESIKARLPRLPELYAQVALDQRVNWPPTTMCGTCA